MGVVGPDACLVRRELAGALVLEDLGTGCDAGSGADAGVVAVAGSADSIGLSTVSGSRLSGSPLNRRLSPLGRGVDDLSGSSKSSLRRSWIISSNELIRADIWSIFVVSWSVCSWRVVSRLFNATSACFVKSLSFAIPLRLNERDGEFA